VDHTVLPAFTPVPTFTSSAEQGKFAGQRPTFYHCATQPTHVAVCRLGNELQRCVVLTHVQTREAYTNTAFQCPNLPSANCR